MGLIEVECNERTKERIENQPVPAGTGENQLRVRRDKRAGRRIDCNEGCNPYGFPPALEEAMADFDIKRFGPYPHSHAIYDGLREYWKGYSDIEPENVLLADGSISALYVIFGLFQAPGAVVLGNAPTFSDAEMAARMLGIEWRAVALNPDRNYRFDPDAFVEQITDDVTMIYIDNPNNPTGQVINLYAIEKILDRALEVGPAWLSTRRMVILCRTRIPQ